MVKKYIIVLLIIFAVIILMQKTKRQIEMNQSPEEKQKDIQKALSEIISKYGRSAAETIERLFRLETRHFKSQQWLKANTPGMEVFNSNFPYGWSSLKKFTDVTGIPENSFSKFSIRENGTGIEKTFVVFPNAYDSMMFVAYLLNSRGWNAGSWYSRDKAKQNEYAESLQSIIPRITNTL